MSATGADVRQRIRRRRRNASSGGMGASDMSSAPSDIREDPEIADLNDHIAENPERFAPPVRPDDADFNPRNRMRDVKTRGGAYEREYRLQLLHRMLMRRVPLDQIAQELDVSISTIMHDRRELYRRLQTEAKKLNVNMLIGDTLGFYNEVQGMALRAASNSKTPMHIRLGALRTALAAKNDTHRFLNLAGVYDVLRFRPQEKSGASDLERLMDVTEKLLANEEIMDEESQKYEPEALANIDGDPAEELELELKVL